MKTTTLREFAMMVADGIVRTDRGQGSAGPVALGRGTDLGEGLDEPLALVTEDENAEAWILARQAIMALGGDEWPEFVAVSLDETHPGYQAIYLG